MFYINSILNQSFLLLAQITPVVTMPIKALSAAQRAWQLSDSYYRRDNNRYRRFKQNFRWALAAAIKPQLSLSWFDMLKQPGMQHFAASNPYLVFRPMRVYMSTRWNKPERMQVILDTYHFVRLQNGILKNALLQSCNTVLARFALPEQGDVQLVLGYDYRFRKEGELVVSVRSATSGRSIASLAFSLKHQADGTWACYIGCIQGGAADVVKTVQKAMHGLRPVALMVFVAQEIATALGITTLYGVGNGIHAHRRKHFIHIASWHALMLDYDNLWAESGGKQNSDGWFRVPLKSLRRTNDAISSNKRSMYRRRYALMDDISRQVHTTLTQ